MAITLKQTEAIPATYPNVDPYTHRTGENWEADDETNEVSSEMLWQRIESYIAHRWTTRQVIWIVEGPGEWETPLTPTTITEIEKWNGTAWETTETINAPQGYSLAEEGPYRFTADVGSGDVPEAVQEAYRRLYEYSKGIANQFRGDAAFNATEETQVTYNWTAKALQLSGAADLLRNYRRA